MISAMTKKSPITGADLHLGVDALFGGREEIDWDASRGAVWREQGKCMRGSLPSFNNQVQGGALTGKSYVPVSGFHRHFNYIQDGIIHESIPSFPVHVHII